MLHLQYFLPGGKLPAGWLGEQTLLSDSQIGDTGFSVFKFGVVYLYFSLCKRLGNEGTLSISKGRMFRQSTAGAQNTLHKHKTSMTHDFRRATFPLVIRNCGEETIFMYTLWPTLCDFFLLKLAIKAPPTSTLTTEVMPSVSEYHLPLSAHKESSWA